MTIAQQILANTWMLFLEAAPWLLLGLVVAGLIRAWIPQSLLAQWLGGRGPWPTIKAALIGAPLPLCSCSVIPVAIGLHRSGASRASTTSFLVATPETGADSIGASYALLGPFFTVVRPVAAIASAVITGLLTNLVAERTPRNDAAPSQTTDSCCEPQPEADDCCSAQTSGCASSASATKTPALTRTGSGLHYAITQILDEFGVWLLLGLVVAGITLTLVPPDTLANYGSGLPAMILLLLISVPLYVCATQSTPIATAMLAAGVSPGAVLVFLLAGPATNLATIGAVRQEFGSRYAACYLAAMSGCALGFGLLTDALVGWLGIDIATTLHSSGEMLPFWLSLSAAIVLLVLATPPLRAPLLRRLAT